MLSVVRYLFSDNRQRTTENCLSKNFLKTYLILKFAICNYENSKENEIRYYCFR